MRRHGSLADACRTPGARRAGRQVRRRGADAHFLRHVVLRLLALGLCLWSPWPGVASAQGQLLPDWSTVESGFYPLAPAEVPQPVLTADDVTDANAYFVADPFLFREGPLWYLFFEVTVPLGKIAVATSQDGLSWQYQHIVLSETFQLSYPHVFEYDGVHYMTPESGTKHNVRLYRASDFPDSWTPVADLVQGRLFTDPTVFRYDDRWWMFVSNTRSDTCWVYSSLQLDRDWTEHPMSPIVAGNRGRARPAGRAVVLSDNRLFRLAQNDTPTYGRAVRVFQVDQLTPTTYHEFEIPESPIVQASGQGWNADGMHQCDPWRVGDHWLAAVDGVSGGTWSIGIYRTPATPAANPPWADPGAGRLGLRCAPNPFGGSTRIRWEIPPGRSTESHRLVIVDPAGRLVLSRILAALPDDATSFAWDGVDRFGRPVPAGTYYCKLEVGARSAATRVVVVR
jgi:hypothetical protein